MKSKHLSLRLPDDLRDFLSREAGRNGVSVTEYVKNLLARGIETDAMDRVAKRIESHFVSLRENGQQALPTNVLEYELEAILEIRVLLREIVSNRDPNGVTKARQSVASELANLIAKGGANEEDE